MSELFLSKIQKLINFSPKILPKSKKFENQNLKEERLTIFFLLKAEQIWPFDSFLELKAERLDHLSLWNKNSVGTDNKKRWHPNIESCGKIINLNLIPHSRQYTHS